MIRRHSKCSSRAAKRLSPIPAPSIPSDSVSPIRSAKCLAGIQRVTMTAVPTKPNDAPIPMTSRARPATHASGAKAKISVADAQVANPEVITKRKLRCSTRTPDGICMAAYESAKAAAMIPMPVLVVPSDACSSSAKTPTDICRAN